MGPAERDNSSALRDHEGASLKDEKRGRRRRINIVMEEKWHQSGLGEGLEPGRRDGAGHRGGGSSATQRAPFSVYG